MAPTLLQNIQATRFDQQLLYNSNGSDINPLLHWLSELPSANKTQQREIAKHTLERSRVLAETDANRMSNYRPPSKKRRRTGEEDYPAELTPRAPFYLKSPPSDLSASSQSQQFSPTKGSRSTSPIKRVTDMPSRPTPLVMLQFNKPKTKLPDGLEQILSTLKLLAKGQGIICESQRVETFLPLLAKLQLAYMNGFYGEYPTNRS
jgi:hypothetical protein